jgi:hypothetical protein
MDEWDDGVMYSILGCVSTTSILYTGYYEFLLMLFGLALEQYFSGCQTTVNMAHKNPTTSKRMDDTVTSIPLRLHGRNVHTVPATRRAVQGEFDEGYRGDTAVPIACETGRTG